MELWELVARESIRDLVARYNLSSDSGRIDAVMQLFAPDAVVDAAGKLFSGRDGIQGMFEAAGVDLKTTRQTARPAYIRHFTSNLQIDLMSPTEATSRCYYLVLMADGLDHWGRYIDQYRCDERWYFSHRRITLDGGDPGGWGVRMARSS
jgi:hypothetical protein